MLWAVECLLKKKNFILKADGVSMIPLLQPKDVIYYQKIVSKKCRVNDLVLIYKNKKLFTHRIIYKTKNYLVTKGDNNLESDGIIHPRQIIAKVYQVKRNGKIFHPESLYLLQSTLYFQEIVKIKNAFEKEKVDFVFLKGLPLHLSYEKSHPRRIYLDCDVLIRKGDFKKAEIILKKAGYKKNDSALSKQHKALKDKEVENSYYKMVNGFPVVFDLHLEVVFMMTQLGKLNALYPQKLIDRLTTEFLATKRGIIVNGEKFSILDSEFLIIYLALHFFHHNFCGAFRLELLDKVIRRICRSEFSSESAILKRVQDDVIKYRLQNFVSPVFFLLKKYFQTPVPMSNITIQQFNNVHVFDGEPRMTAGIGRFKNLFFLSPNPLWRKVFVFFNPAVAYSIFWTIKRRLFSFFSNRPKAP